MKATLPLFMILIVLSACNMKQDKTAHDNIENISQPIQDSCNIRLREYSYAIDTVAYEYFSDMEYAEMINLLEQHTKTLMELFKETEKHLKHSDVQQAEICMSAYFNDYESCADFQAALKLFHFIRIKQKRLWRKNSEMFALVIKNAKEAESHLNFILDRVPTLKKSISSLLKQNDILKLETDSTNADGSWKSKPATYPTISPDSARIIMDNFFNNVGK